MRATSASSACCVKRPAERKRLNSFIAAAAALRIFRRSSCSASNSLVTSKVIPFAPKASRMSRRSFCRVPCFSGLHAPGIADATVCLPGGVHVFASTAALEQMRCWDLDLPPPRLADRERTSPIEQLEARFSKELNTLLIHRAGL